MKHTVKIRLEGLPADVDWLTDQLKRRFNVVNESKDYQNVGRYVRRYLTIHEEITVSVSVR